MRPAAWPGILILPVTRHLHVLTSTPKQWWDMMLEPIVHQTFAPEQGVLSFYTYEVLTQLLHDCVAAYPALAEIASIGKSLEGRDLWLVTVTNKQTGPALEKPAYWLDGNTHAGEVTGSTVVLCTLW